MTTTTRTTAEAVRVDAQYEPVTAAGLQEFLRRVGRAVCEPGRVYLVGGTGLIYQGLKGLTKDIDLATLRYYDG